MDGSLSQLHRLAYDVADKCNIKALSTVASSWAYYEWEQLLCA